MVRGVKTWGRTWRLAGFEEVGETQGGLLALRIRAEDVPAPKAPLGVTMPLQFLPEINYAMRKPPKRDTLRELDGKATNAASSARDSA